MLVSLVICAGAGTALIVTLPQGLIVAAVLALSALAVVEPLAVLVPFFLLEEYYANAPLLAVAPPTMTFGHEFYEAEIVGVPLPLLVLVAGALLGFLRSSPRGVGLRSPIVVLVVLSALSAALTVSQSSSDAFHTATAVLRTADPWLQIVLASYLVVVRVASRHSVKIFSVLVSAAIFFKALVAIVTEVFFGGVTIDTQQHVAFFDAATPAIAGAVVVYIVAGRRRRASAVQLLLAAASLVIVVLSFRRSIWLMVALGIILVPLVTRNAAGLRRGGALAGVGLVGVVLLPGSLVQVATDRVIAATQVLSGTNTSDTALLHLQDISNGLQIALSHPIAGLGVEAPQPSTFANQLASTVYVHNEFLQIWLRFGLAGAVLFVVLLATLARRALRQLRKPGNPALVECAAIGVLLLALPLMTAPFVTTTHRWGALVGGAAGALLLSAPRRPSSARPVARPVSVGRAAVASKSFAEAVADK